jgi:acetyl-CoA acetyltransferase
MGEEVYVLGVGMIRFGKYPEKSVKDLTADAVHALLRDAPLGDTKEIEAAWFSNSMWGQTQGQHSIRGQVALAPLGIQGLPIMNVENGCAGATSALHGGWMGVKAGIYDLVLAIGVEKVWFPEDKAKMFGWFMSGMDVEFGRALIGAFQEHASSNNAEKGSEGRGKGGSHSPFMDVYGMGARLHMERYGTTQRQLAVISSKNHHHGSLNPLAQYQKDMSVEEVLADKVVAYPLTRPMCAPIGDGAAAALLCSKRFLKKYPDARPVRIRASVLASGALPDSGLEPIGTRLSNKAYEQAGIGPEDVDVAEVHDATAFGELLQCEELGFCGEGEGGSLAESGETALGGKLPINTSGGLECRGHPIGASGLAQIHELVTQLRGQAGPRQVEGAKIAMSENGGGFIGLEEAAMCLHILEG